MRELWEFTKLIRSKNAGPFELTFDIMFKDENSFREVMASGKLSAELIAQLCEGYVLIAARRPPECPAVRRLAGDSDGGRRQ